MANTVIVYIHLCVTEPLKMNYVAMVMIAQY